jgi:hypothetical protein
MANNCYAGFQGWATLALIKPLCDFAEPGYFVRDSSGKHPIVRMIRLMPLATSATSLRSLALSVSACCLVRVVGAKLAISSNRFITLLNSFCAFTFEFSGRLAQFHCCIRCIWVSTDCQTFFASATLLPVPG